MKPTLSMLGWNRRTIGSWAGDHHAIHLPGALGALRAITPPPCHGAVVIATCERLEVYCSGPKPMHEITQVVFPGTAKVARRHARTRFGAAAAHHLFRVAAGLDSRLIGEPHVLGQVRRAAEAAREHQTINPQLMRLFEHAIRCGKRVRNETTLGRAATTYAGLAAERVVIELPAPHRASVGIIGTGAVALETGERLNALAIGHLAILGRHPRRTDNLALHLGATPVHLKGLSREVHTLDAIITATSAPHAIVAASDLANARDNLVLVDLGIPPNIAPFGAHPFTYIALDDLTPGHSPAQTIVEEAQAIIQVELGRFTNPPRRSPSHATSRVRLPQQVTA